MLIVLCWKAKLRSCPSWVGAPSSNHPISAILCVIHTLIHRAEQISSTPEFLAKGMYHPHNILQDNHYPAQFFQQAKSQQKAKPIHRKAYRRNKSCHTIHQRPQWTIQMQPTQSAKLEFSLKAPAPSSLYSCIQKIQFQILRKLT